MTLHITNNIRLKRFIANISIILFTVVFFNVASEWNDMLLVIAVVLGWLPLVVAYGFYISSLTCPHCGTNITCKIEQGHYANKILSPLCVPSKCPSCGYKVK